MFTRLAQIAFGLVLVAIPFLSINDGLGGDGVQTGSGMLKKLISGERKKVKKVEELQHEEFRSQGSDSDTFSNKSVEKVKKYRRRRKSNLEKLEDS